MPQSFTAFVINMDRDTVRLRHMETQLAAAGIVWTRRPGCAGDAVPPDLKPYFFHPDGRPRTGMKRGEIGCYASHLQLLIETAAGRHGAHVLIMEDDLNIDADALTLLDAACAAMPPGWDILRLSNPPDRAYVPLTAMRPRPNGPALVRYSRIPNSAGAYLVTRAGAAKFVAGGVRGLTFDDDLRRPWFHGMDSYGLVPPPMQAGSVGASTIDAIEGGRFDKPVGSGMERLLRGDHAYALRRAAYHCRTLGLGAWLAASAVNLADMAVRVTGGHTLIHRAARLMARRSG